MLEPFTFLVLFFFREGKWIRTNPPITHRPERGERTILMEYVPEMAFKTLVFIPHQIEVLTENLSLYLSSQ